MVYIGGLSREWKNANDVSASMDYEHPSMEVDAQGM